MHKKFIEDIAIALAVLGLFIIIFTETASIGLATGWSFITYGTVLFLKGSNNVRS